MTDTPHSDPTVELVKKSGSLDFEAAACFRLSNIKRYFEDDPAVKPPSSIWTPFFGPQLRLCIRPSGGSAKDIAIFLHLPESSILPRPTFTSYTVVLLSSNTQTQADRKTYRTWTLSHDFANDSNWGLLDALTSKTWAQEESLRNTDSLDIEIKVVGSLSQAPTPRSSGVLNLLYQDISDEPRSVFRFTTFDRRDRSKVRKSLADRDIIQKTCPVLHDYLTGKLKRKGFIIDDCSDGIPAEVGSDNDSDFEDDEEPTQISTHPCSESQVHSDKIKHSESHEPCCPTQKIQDDDDSQGNAEQRLPKNPEPTEGKDGIGYYIMDAEDSMQIDSGDSKLKISKSVPTDSPLLNDARFTDIVVVGAAAATWEAFLFYLYTGIIEFAPLLSRGRTERDTYVKNFKAVNRPKSCSPKSIYRLAQAMDQVPLKQIALKKIVEQLSVENVLSELFSVFTSKHEEVQEQELKFFSEHSDVIMESQAFRDLIMDIAIGSYPHAGKVLEKVFQKVRSFGQIEQKSSSDQKDADTGTGPGKNKGGKGKGKRG